MRLHFAVGFACLLFQATQLLSGQAVVAILGSPVTTCPTTPVTLNSLNMVTTVNTNQVVPAGTVLTYNFSAPVRSTPTIPGIEGALIRVVNAGSVGAVVVYAPTSTELMPGRPLQLNGVQVDASSLKDGGVVTVVPVVADPSKVNLPSTPITVARADTSLCPNPVPVITEISPASMIVGGPPPTLTVTGTRFIPESRIQYNGAPLPTTFISSTQLTANLELGLVQTPALAEVTVFNPSTKAGPGGGTSAPVVFAVQHASGNPFPVITTVFPNTIEGGPRTEDVILVISGTGFMKEAAIKWNGTTILTDQVFPPANHVTGTVPANFFQVPGLVQVWVENPLPNGGLSNLLIFKIDEPRQTVTEVYPTGVPASNQSFTMQVSGTNFTTQSKVLFNGVQIPTTFLSSGTLFATVSTSLVSTGGLATVMVQGAFTLSNAQMFTIRNPPPVLTSMTPSNVAAGVPPFTLSLTGTEFVPGSEVRWNGQVRPTTYINALRLTAVIPASDLLTQGTAAVTVTNPSPGGGVTGALPFTITAAGNNPVPSVANLSPAQAPAGKGALTVLVNGANFAGASVVRWNGQNRPTTVLSATQLRASLTAQDTAAAGTAQVTVFSPAPGGGVSSALTFTVALPSTAEDLVASCPSALEVTELNAKLPLIFDSDPTAGTLVCRAADGSADLTRLKERAFQALRAMKQTTFDAALPWTSKNLLDWAGGALKGVRFRSNISQATCCDDGVASIPTGNLSALQTTRWLDPQAADRGLADLVVQIAAQARLNEGFTLGCGAKDNSLSDGGSWAVQYYLWEWLAFRSGTFLTSTLPGLSSGYYSEVAWRNAQTVRDTQFCSTAGGIVVNGTSRNFGNQTVNTTSSGLSIVVSATTSNPITVTDIAFGGANASDFLITNNTCQGATVPRSCLITVLFNPTALGNRSAVLNLTHSASSSAISIGLGGTGTPPAPSVNPGGILNGASFGTSLSGGALASLFGASLGSGTSGATGLPLPTTLGQTSVQMNGSNVPLIFVSPLQINFQVPWELLGQTAATLTVSAGGAVSAPQQVTLTPAAPAIFAVSQDGRGQGAILIANAGDLLAAPAGSVAGRSSRPARRGESVTLFCVGLGAVSNRPASGAAALSEPLSLTQATPTVTIGGVSANVTFSGLAPGFVGLYQVNVQIPDGVTDGNSVAVVLSVGGVASNTVTMAVGQ